MSANGHVMPILSVNTAACNTFLYLVLPVTLFVLRQMQESLAVAFFKPMTTSKNYKHFYSLAGLYECHSYLIISTEKNSNEYSWPSILIMGLC